MTEPRKHRGKSRPAHRDSAESERGKLLLWIREARDDGATVEELAAATGYSVPRMYKFLMLAGRPASAEDAARAEKNRKAVVAYRREGLSPQAIADRLGITASRVSAIANEEGVGVSQVERQSRMAAIRAFAAAGYSRIEIAEHLGCTPQNVGDLCRRNGIVVRDLRRSGSGQASDSAAQA
jgi:DNA-binding CsgD family transcriptional regulator